MTYKFPQVQRAHEKLLTNFVSLDDKKAILKDPELKKLFNEIRELEPKDRGAFGAEVNSLKNEVQSWVDKTIETKDTRDSIDITALFSTNIKNKAMLLNRTQGSKHPITAEIEKMLDIYNRMGFTSMESREIDDDFHMFESLNFPEGHPARDDFDTFMTEEGLIAPAHTSTMQNRALKKFKDNLAKGEPIAVVIPDRVYRNEDLDVTHEHTFYQLEGIYVGKNINVGNLIAVLKTFMSEYYGQELKAKLQPFYFPFTEPSFEFAIERPESLRKGDTEADMWLELLGCGMIHPNVLKMAGINHKIYTGFAWGGGVERLIMMKHEIEDIRHFESGKLEFLRQF